jgi:hypothetical protein
VSAVAVLPEPAAELVASPDELDALAFALAGTRFPGLGPTLLQRVGDRDRGTLARRLLLPLAARGVLDPGGPLWTVAGPYRRLLSAVLEPDVAVCVHVRRSGSSGTAIACQRDGVLVLHDADPAGWHRLALRAGTLTGAVLDLLDAPPASGKAQGGPVRRRYSAVLRSLADPPAEPFVAALLDHDYAAKLTLLGHRSGTYQAQSLAVLGAPGCPLWIVEVEPDGEDDGWLTATPAGAELVRERVGAFCAGTGEGAR